MKIALLMVFGLFWVSVCNAQTGPLASASGEVSPEQNTYVLGPGDQVTVSVLDLNELGKEAYRIDMNGYLTLPLVGRLPVNGMTLEQATEEIRGQFRKYLKNPDVTVALIEMHSQPVSVLGEVRNPGVVQLMGQKTLFEILSLAGGLNPDAGYLIHVVRQKQWGTIPLPDAKLDETGQFWMADVSVKEVMDGTSPGKNIEVKPNDVITVPKGEVVYVLGAVKKSGGFVLGEKDQVSVLQALSLAEGLDRFANTGDTKILRKSPNPDKRIEIPVDLKKILQGKAVDVPLLRDDILFVPISGSKEAVSRTVEAVLTVGTNMAMWRTF